MSKSKNRKIADLISGGIDSRNVTTDGAKLDGVETGATADQTKADIDALNINADLLDGQHGAYYTGYTDTAVAGIVDSSPAALNTLNELAAALGDDANYATTTATSIGTKMPIAGGTFTGAINVTGTVTANSFVGDGSALTGIEGVPSGIISMWSGAITAIPSGWVICNGLNGTPNLTDRFVIHADADSGGTRNVGASGGAHNTTISSANLPSHSHSVGNIATSTAGNHTHSDGNYSAASAGNHSHGAGNYSTSNVGNHTHSTGKTSSGVYGASNTSTYKGASATNGNTGGAGAHSHNVGGNSSNTGAHTHNVAGNSGGAGSHSHSMSGNTGSSGSGSAISTIPAFYALAYIMKS
jgi:hypothetical protein